MYLLLGNTTSTAQHSTAQHSTAQHSTAQHSTAQHSTEQAQHSVTIPGHAHQNVVPFQEDSKKKELVAHTRHDGIPYSTDSNDRHNRFFTEQH